MSRNWRQMLDSKENEEGRGHRKGCAGAGGCGSCEVGQRWGARKGGRGEGAGGGNAVEALDDDAAR